MHINDFILDSNDTTWYIQPYLVTALNGYLFQIIFPIFSAYIWLWWMYRSYKAPRSSVWVMLVWASYSMIFILIHLGVNSLIIGNPWYYISLLSLALQKLLSAGVAIFLFSFYLSLREKIITLA